MPATDSLLTLALSSVLLSLAPGPDNIFVLTLSALYGRKSGFFVVLGLCTGLVVHTTLVALGVAAVFQTSTTAFNGLKIIGAAYLLYLAWQAVKTSQEDTSSKAAIAELGFSTLYRRGIVMNLTNPKVSIFFLAFLPQFANPKATTIAPQIFLFGFIFILATFIVFNFIALLSGSISQWFSRSTRAQSYLNKIAALVFFLLAVSLIAPIFRQ